MEIKITVMKKYRIGTRINLLVALKKSAAASTTSMAVFSDLKPHTRQIKKQSERIAKTIPAAKYVPALSAVYPSRSFIFATYVPKLKMVAPIMPSCTRMIMPHAMHSAKMLIR